MLMGASPLAARTLRVGEGAAYPTLAAAMAQAQGGDIVHIAAGEYFECAAIRVADLVLEGEGPATILTDRTCDGKALLVAQADRLTVRDLVLARARVPDMNGAGVRLEAQGLVLERVTFRNNQVGVMSGISGPGEVRMTECRFTAGGIAGARPTYAVWIGAVGRLVIERSSFAGVKGGQIISGAQRTELVGNRIETGAEPGAGHAVLLQGGTLAMRDNVIVVGPNAPPRDAAVRAEGDGVELRGNRLENTTGQSQRLLLDWTRTSPVLAGNQMAAGDTEVSSAGVWRHRAGGMARGVMADARAAAGATKQAVKSMLGR